MYLCTSTNLAVKSSSAQVSLCSLHTLKISCLSCLQALPSLIRWAWASSLISLCLSFQTLRWGLEVEPTAVGSTWGLSRTYAQVKEWYLMGSVPKSWRSWFWVSILCMSPTREKTLEAWRWSSSITTPWPWAQGWQQPAQQAHKGQHGTGVPFGCGATLQHSPGPAMWARNRAQDSSQYTADERRHEITNLMKKSF